MSITRAQISTVAKHRQVYLIVDSDDQGALGGVTSHVYTTFQSAYDAANALSIALGNQVVSIVVGSMSGANPGDVNLTADWNTNVFIEGIGREVSQVGSIITNGFSIGAPGTSLEINNLYIAGITTSGGNVFLEAINSLIGDGGIDTSSASADGGNIFIGEVFQSGNLLISGSITTSSTFTNGNGGQVYALMMGGRMTLYGLIISEGNGIGNGGDITLEGDIVVLGIAADVSAGSIITSGGTSGGSAGSIKFAKVYVWTDTSLGNPGIVMNHYSATTINLIAAHGWGFSGLSINLNSAGGSVNATLDGIQVGEYKFPGLGAAGPGADAKISVSGGTVNWYLNDLSTVDGYTLDGGINPTTPINVTGGIIDLSILPDNLIRQEVIINSTDSNISILNGMPDNWPIRFQPISGLTITFVNGVLRCLGNINVILNGTNNEWIEFTKINGTITQTNSYLTSLKVWSTSGNAGTTDWFLSGNAIGTTDGVALTFIVQNQLAARLEGNELGSTYNTYFGVTAGNSMNPSGTGTQNTFIGYGAGYTNTTGSNNIYVGSVAGINNSGSNNIILAVYPGNNALSSGNDSVLIGYNSGLHATGNNNTYVGGSSGAGDFAGTNNVLLGYQANVGSTGLTNAIAIGANAVVNASNTLVLGGTGGNAVNVAIGATTASATLYIVGSTIDLQTGGANANVAFWSTEFGSGQRVTAVANAVTIPTTNPTVGIISYSEGGQWKYRDTSGNIITI